jgi:transposase
MVLVIWLNENVDKGYAIRDVAKLTGKGISTIQRVKKEFC